MADHRIGAPKELSLDDLNEWLKDQEATFGPIKEIGRTDTETFGVFGFSLDPAPAHVIVPAADAGDDPVCEGEVFVDGEPTDVAVIASD